MRSEIKIITTVVFSIIALLTLFLSINIVREGEVGVVTRFSEYNRLMVPGLHFKIPFVESVVEFNVRQTKDGGKLASATDDRLPVEVDVSYNWRIDESRVEEVFVKYGTPERFKDNIILPRVKQIAKEAVAKYEADEMISNREAVSNEFAIRLADSLSDYPVVVGAAFMENFRFPDKYMDSIVEKERAKEDAEKAKYEVEKQKIEQEKLINTAEAEAEAIRIEAEARADAIALVNAQITEGYINYRTIEKWTGVMPHFLSGDGGNLDIIIDSTKAGANQ